MEFNFEKEDLYELLGLEHTCSTEEVKKAYRKRALQCHPDKNPDNPNAALEFHKLTKILEILTDVSARKAYDQVLKARKEAELRNKQLDSKRQKLKRDLEEREKGVLSSQQKSADQKLKEEIERLRKEGSRQVQEETEYILRQLRKDLQESQPRFDSTKYRIKIKWKATKNDPNNGGYTYDTLHKFLSKYGDINVLVMSKKQGSALVEFASQRAAEMAIDIEKGTMENQLELSWVNDQVKSRPISTTIKESDYESVTLTKLRQAEERKRLIEEMIQNDSEDN